MSIERAITPDVVASLLRGDGLDTARLAVECEFGSTIAEHPTQAGQPDTLLEWDGTDVAVQISLDGGRTFRNVIQRVSVAGARETRIPGLDVGAALTNKTVRARVFFLNPDARLRSIRAKAVLESGEVFDRTLTPADFDSDTAVGVVTAAADSVLKPLRQRTLGFFGHEHARFAHISPTESGPKHQTQVSRGRWDRHTTGRFVEISDPESDEAFALSAMGFDGWVYSPIAIARERTICAWRTSWDFRHIDDDPPETQTNFGSRFYITDDGRLAFEFGNYVTFLGTHIFDQIDREVVFSHPDVPWLGRWVHVAFGFDGVAMHLFIDGHLASSRAIPEGRAVIPTDGDFYIGNDPGLSYPLEGMLLHARLWHIDISRRIHKVFPRRMTTEQAAALHADGDLAAFWPLETGGDDLGPQGLTLDLREGVKSNSLRLYVGGRIPPPRYQRDRAVRPVPYWDVELLDISTDSNVERFVTGHSDVTFSDGRVFVATGDLLQVSDQIRETGQVDPNVGMTFTLTGLDPQWRSIAMNAIYQDRPIRLYPIYEDRDGVLIDDNPAPMWEGRMDQLVPLIRKQGDSAILTIALKAETHLRDFDRPSSYRWNKASHRALFPDDAGFDEVAEVAERQLLWPTVKQIEDAGP